MPIGAGAGVGIICRVALGVGEGMRDGLRVAVADAEGVADGLAVAVGDGVRVAPRVGVTDAASGVCVEATANSESIVGVPAASTSATVGAAALSCSARALGRTAARRPRPQTAIAAITRRRMVAR